KITHQKSTSMFKNYFKTAWRSLVNNKAYSALNILGLATGMAVALIIGLWVYYQYSYDKFLPDYKRVYQVRRNFYGNGDTMNYGGTSLKLATILRTQIPEVQYVAETDGFSMHGLKVDNKKFYIKGGQVGSDFLKMFQYTLLEGNANDVLNNPYSIVLTQSIAKALFGNKDPINKVVRFDNKNDLKVTGVLKDIPSNSTLQFSYLVPFSYLESTDDFTKTARTKGFGWTNYMVFVKLKDGISYAQVEPKIKDLEKTETDNFMSMKTNIILDNVANWHLYENFDKGKLTTGFIQYVNIFTIIGILVLLIACINFINLTTARSEKRAREVGVRKAIGSGKSHLIFQFLIESVLLTFIAFIFSLLFVQVTLPAFNTLTNSDIKIPFTNYTFWLIALSCVLLTGLLAGSRPAFYLSSFEPVKVLKGKINVGKAAALPRQILVVLQFSCSIALIICTYIIYQQVQYAKDRPSGYDQNRLMITNMNEDLGNNYTAIKNELIEKNIASSVTTATASVTDGANHRDVEDFPGKRPGESVDMGWIKVSDDYFKTLGMQMKDGRNFDSPSDTLNVIFNEAAVKLLRLKNPLNQTITWIDTKFKIIGMVKNALMQSPFEQADPTMFFYDPHPQDVIMYRLSSNIKTQDAITKLTSIFNQYNPAYPYTYTFADDNYAAKFKLETLIGKLSGLFAALAVFISCLGLFGLAAYVAEQRTKEIGIRKVLGASVSQVWLMLSKDFIVLVLISCVIASPVAYYYMHDWLQQYDYRITISAVVFFVAGIMAILITIVTISFQAIKAAIANPVKSLRTE
ncbi:MAG TPA: ABC transporter permease, partial [Parafilimonas sp.]|nr:ABC transporter permease [Parafilimonas sp.]